jgi:hypothetical protein
MPDVTLADRQRGDRARLRFDRAGNNLAVVVRLGLAVNATVRADLELHLAAQQTYHDAANTMTRCELLHAVKLAGLELGRLGWTGYSDTPTTPEGS